MWHPVIRVALLLLAGAGLARAAPVQLSLWNPVQLVDDEADIRGIRIDLPYGRNRDVVGLDVGVINGTRRDGYGVQIGLALNDAGFFHVPPDAPGRLKGVQLTPLMNTAGEAAGLQAGGLANLARGDLRGVQLSWLVNMVMGDTCGLQAGMGNFTQKRAAGVQLAPSIIAALNLAGDIRGAQVSTGVLSMNKTGTLAGLQLNLGLLGNHANDVSGIQLAATCNVARYVDGIQVGLVNVCRFQSGVQLGLINWTERIDGVQIGVLNVATGKTSGTPLLPVVNAGW